MDPDLDPKHCFQERYAVVYSTAAELPELRQDHSLLLLLLGVAMSRLAPLLLQEEDDSKDGDEDGKDGREDRKKKFQVLHTACY
jgi:hypothetical protein